METSAGPPPRATSDRTTLNRHAERGSHEIADARQILAHALVGHIGVIDAAGFPVVLPVAVAPSGDEVLCHGSTGSRLFRAVAAGAPMCLTVTHLEGLVLARSAFESSMNYRCLVAFGVARVLQGSDKAAALRVLTDHLSPGRWDRLRPLTRKEIAATEVLALPLTEFSVKSRTGGPDDPAEDLQWPVWAGVIPLVLQAGPARPEPGSVGRPAPETPTGVRPSRPPLG